MPGTEPLYRMDLVLDTKKPMWSMLQEMAALYRSSVIQSNGKFKIISERDDLPVRQVFHSGNILRDKTQIRVGTDPAQFNQLTGQFSNKVLNYERDILIIEDSQSVLIDNDPIRPTEFDMTGVVRKSEVNRRLSVEMQRRKEVKTEMTFTTNQEGISVEAGDICIAGIIMPDFEMGYGGRALDGSTDWLLADKIVNLNSGTNYDLWVWHVAADTPEMRTVVGTVPVARLIPTSSFNQFVQPQDRWALGVQSEDLVKLLVKKVVYNEDGTTQITGDQFVSIGYLLDCPDSVTSYLDYYNMPSFPWSITTVQTNCTLCFQLKFTAPSCIGGATIQAAPTFPPFGTNAFMMVFPDTTNLPTKPISSFPGSDLTNYVGYLIDNTITFISGPNSGVSRRILNYPKYIAASGQYHMMVSPLPNLSGNGDQYYITIDQGSNFSGFKVTWFSNSNGFLFADSVDAFSPVFGNSACFDFSNTADSLYVELQMISPLGAVTYDGLIMAFSLAGCFAQDERVAYSVSSITTQSLTNLLAMFLPGSELSTDASFRIKAYGFLNDACDVNEDTRVSFGVTYGGSTVINSLIVTMRDVASPAFAIGSNAPFVLTSEITRYSVPINHARVSLKYEGQVLSNSGTTFASTLMLSGMINSLNLNAVNSFTFTVDVEHKDTGGSVHSHQCFAVALDHGEFQIIDPLGAAI